MKRFMVDIGDDFNEPAKLDAIIELLAQACEQWDVCVGAELSGELGQAMRSALACFKCMLGQESLRPLVAEARSARRTLFAFAKERRSAAADLAKAISIFGAGQAALAAALSHSKASIEDAIALQGFEAAAAKLEDIIRPFAFKLEDWVLTGNAGVQHDFVSFNPAIRRSTSPSSASWVAWALCCA